MLNSSVILVNGYWLEQFLTATHWHIDADDHPLNRLNMENEASRIFLVEEYLRPAWQELSQTQKSMVKETLRYGLNFFTIRDWENYTHHQLPDITRAPATFFAGIWLLFFPNEPCRIIGSEIYIRHDIQEPLLFDNKFKYAH